MSYPGEPLVDALEKKADIDNANFPPFADPIAGRTPSSGDIEQADLLLPEPTVDQYKYVVFKRNEYNDAWMNFKTAEGRVPFNRIQLPDTVVIRLQDVFAAPALDTYANSIQVAVKAMKMEPAGYNEGLVKRLSNLADFFHEMAERARDEDGFVSKIPD